MTDWTEDEEGWAYHGWARGAQHSEVTRLAPTDETALTIRCGRRILARVWPWGAPATRQFIVTTSGRSPLLDARWPAHPASCACRRRAHLIDREKLVEALAEVATVQPSRQPSVSITGVSRDKGDSHK
jgi:hypothetical protein